MPCLLRGPERSEAEPALTPSTSLPQLFPEVSDLLEVVKLSKDYPTPRGPLPAAGDLQAVMTLPQSRLRASNGMG